MRGQTLHSFSPRLAGIGKSPVHDGADILRMPAGRYLRDDSSVELMFLYLRGDDVREHIDAVFHHGGGGVVT